MHSQIVHSQFAPSMHSYCAFSNWTLAVHSQIAPSMHSHSAFSNCTFTVLFIVLSQCTLTEHHDNSGKIWQSVSLNFQIWKRRNWSFTCMIRSTWPQYSRIEINSMTAMRIWMEYMKDLNINVTVQSKMLINSAITDL